MDDRAGQEADGEEARVGQKCATSSWAQDVVARKYAPAQLAMEDLYSRELGPPLTGEARRVVASLPDLTGAQVAVAHELASRERAFGLLYLTDVVKSAATSATPSSIPCCAMATHDDGTVSARVQALHRVPPI